MLDPTVDAWLRVGRALGLAGPDLDALALGVADPSAFLARCNDPAALGLVSADEPPLRLVVLRFLLARAEHYVGIDLRSGAADVAGNLESTRPARDVGARVRLPADRFSDFSVLLAAHQLSAAGVEVLHLSLSSGDHELAVVPAADLDGVLRAALDAHPFADPVAPGDVMESTVPVVRYIDVAEAHALDGGREDSRWSVGWTRDVPPPDAMVPPTEAAAYDVRPRAATPADWRALALALGLGDESAEAVARAEAARTRFRALGSRPAADGRLPSPPLGTLCTVLRHAGLGAAVRRDTGRRGVEVLVEGLAPVDDARPRLDLDPALDAAANLRHAARQLQPAGVDLLLVASTRDRFEIAAVPRAAWPVIDAAAHELRLDADGAPPLLHRIAEPPAPPA